MSTSSNTVILLDEVYYNSWRVSVRVGVSEFGNSANTGEIAPRRSLGRFGHLNGGRAWAARKLGRKTERKDVEERSPTRRQRVYRK